MSPGARRWLLVGLPALLGACTSLARPSEMVATRQEAVAAQHRRRAAALEASGSLRRALGEWGLALTIEPDDPEAQAGRNKLEARIELAVVDRLRQGREALTRGAPLEARRQFLAVLALDPANREAFDALRAAPAGARVVPQTVRSGEILQLGPAEGRAPADLAPPGGEAGEVNALLADAREALEARQFEVALSDVDNVLAASPGSPDSVELKKTILYRYGKAQLDDGQYAGSYRTLADLAKLDPKYLDSAALREQARGRLIQDLYQEGIRLFRDEDLQGAIAKWRALLEYDSTHAEARKNIEQAERLLRALEERQQEQQ